MRPPGSRGAARIHGGKAGDGGKLLFLFALVMVVVGVLMLRGRGDAGNPGAE
jgi:hypothetical protein